MEQWKRLAITISVLGAGAFSVGHAAGSHGSAVEVSECRAAVVAALDDYRGVEGAFERFMDYAGRCV